MHYRTTICNKQSINGVALSVAMLMHKVCVPINLILFCRTPIDSLFNDTIREVYQDSVPIGFHHYRTMTKIGVG